MNTTTQSQPITTDTTLEPRTKAPLLPQRRNVLTEQHWESFNIRNFSDRLEPAKEKNKYFCPVCKGNDLSIQPDTGKYQCFHGCECRDIREAVAPWAEKRRSQPHPRRVLPKCGRKPVPEPVLLPSGELIIARLLEIPLDIPQPMKPQFTPTKRVKEDLLSKGVKEEGLKEITITTYDYGSDRKAHRYQAPADNPKGYEKTFAISRTDATGKTQWNKGKDSWAAYRQDEAIAALLAVPTGQIPVLLSHEGEKCVEALRALKMAGITTMGNSSLDDLAFILDQIKSQLGDRVFIFAHCLDNDKTGIQKAQKWADACVRAQIPFVAIDLKTIKPDLCEKGDIVDILASGMDGEELAQLLQSQIKYVRLDESGKAFKDDEDIEEIPDTLSPNITFTQKAMSFLYGDRPWINADGKLYYWSGNHYKHSPDSVERPRIASYCNSYVVYVEASGGGRRATYPYAKTSSVEEILKWVKMRTEINPDLLNPSGINCTNGVVGVKWETGKPVRYIEPHDPSKHYFIYEPLVKYDPSADQTDCDRLLECLDSPQQQVLLRNLAASIDLPEVRKRRGREVKLLLACGLGSNGKDALRQTVSTIFGHFGMTSVSLADFVHYDEGRKFALAPLMSSRVNWASENPQTARLDKIQSLKLFATGNPLHCERKGKDHIEFNPKGVGIFNLNDVPPLQGTQQAIQDRFAPLEFRKTFKNNPNPDDPNELQADPRFAYDDDFVRQNVAPAFLNKMLDAMEALIEEGVDYECTTDAFKSMQLENNHLLQFCADIGLDYNPNGSMTAMDIWTHLEEWYIDNGTLTLGEDGKKRSWAEQARPSDHTLKAPNQVVARFKQLFPKAKLVTVPHVSGKKVVQALQGISITTHNDSTPVNEFFHPSSTPVPPQSPPQQSLINQGFHPTHPNLSNIGVELEKHFDQPSQEMNNLPPKVEEDSSQLGWVGCDDAISSIPGVETGVELGWSNPSTGVEETVEELKVGDRVTHADPYHARSGSLGEVEKIGQLASVLVRWVEDGQNQKHDAHRSYSACDLKKLEGAESREQGEPTAQAVG